MFLDTVEGDNELRRALTKRGRYSSIPVLGIYDRSVSKSEFSFCILFRDGDKGSTYLSGN
jgi:hypothetical protein